MPPERMRQLIIAFWVIIGVALAWQFYSYNQSITQQEIDHPTQTRFVFLHTNAAPVAPSMAHIDKADVQQTAFQVQAETPSAGSYTCVVTLKNVGNQPATGIQICIRPYRGTSNYDVDVGHQNTHVLTDDDPLSQFSDWLSFPDLAPGETATRTDVFLNRDDARPGVNPNPQIIFESIKPKPGSPPSAPPTPAPNTTPAPAPAPPANVHHGAEDS